MSNDLTKPNDQIAKRFAVGPKLSPLAQKMRAAAEATKSREEVARTCDNRIVLILDDSGSMRESASGHYGSGTSKQEYARRAAEAFVDSIDFDSTSVAIVGMNKTIKTPLMVDPALLISELQRYNCPGQTPLFESISSVINSIPLTRGILISDGEATDRNAESASSEQAVLLAKEAGIAFDCVHIGSSAGGEDTLKTIAKETGGIYIKFKNAAAFVEALTYLTPQKRAKLFLTGGAALLKGADEVIL